MTETLEVIPRRWKVIQTVREKFTCRDCERISQPPAPFHATPRGWAGPNLLATILFEKYGQHLPLNRQRDRYAREGVDLSLSTLADQVGACAVALKPLHDLIAAHVLAAERLHGDDTPVPVLAKGKTDTARAWVYVRDDAPFGGPDPPAALFRYSRDRSGDHPVEHLQTFAGILQADAYAGYRRLYAAGRSPGPVIEALCWAHGRRKFYELADIAANKRRGKRAPPISPLALEAVKRIDALFDIEREINGKPAGHRHAVRRERSAPLVAELEDWMRMERAGLSRHASAAKAMDYMLKRWGSFARFLDDGRICLTNNAAERALRGIALGRRAWLFAGSDRGGIRAAVMYTLIGTAKLNDVDPQAWLADVLNRIADLPQTRLQELLPWSLEGRPATGPRPHNLRPLAARQLPTTTPPARRRSPKSWRMQHTGGAVFTGGVQLERRIRQLAPYAPARCLPHRRPPIPVRLRPLAPCTGFSAHTMPAALHCRRFGLSRRARRRLPPTINHAWLTSAASDPRRRLQVMKLPVTVATGRQCRHPLYTN